MFNKLYVSNIIFLTVSAFTLRFFNVAIISPTKCGFVLKNYSEYNIQIKCFNNLYVSNIYIIY